MALAPHSRAKVVVADDLYDSLSTGEDRVHEEAGQSFLDLEPDPSHGPRHHRLLLPHRLRHHQPEALSDGFLHDDGRRPLQGVHPQVVDAVQVREDVDVGVAIPMLVREVEVLHALGIVVCERADEHELEPVDISARQPKPVNDAQWIFPGIEPRNLTDDRAGGIDGKTAHDLESQLLRQGRVLDRHRVDRRGNERDPRSRDARLGEFGQGEDRGVVSIHDALEELPNRPERSRQIDVASPDP